MPRQSNNMAFIMNVAVTCLIVKHMGIIYYGNVWRERRDRNDKEMDEAIYRIRIQ